MPTGLRAHFPPGPPPLRRRRAPSFWNHFSGGPSSPHTSWAALVNHYEDDGTYRCTELLHDRRPPAAQRRRPRRGVRSHARRHPLTSPWWALETP